MGGEQESGPFSKAFLKNILPQTYFFHIEQSIVFKWQYFKSSCYSETHVNNVINLRPLLDATRKHRANRKMYIAVMLLQIKSFSGHNDSFILSDSLCMLIKQLKVCRYIGLTLLLSTANI